MATAVTLHAMIIKLDAIPYIEEELHWEEGGAKLDGLYYCKTHYPFVVLLTLCFFS